MFLVDFSLLFFDLNKKFNITIKFDKKPNEEIIVILKEYFLKEKDLFLNHS